MIRIIVHAGDGPADEISARGPSSQDWSEHGPEEALRRIGLEYKQADYFPTRQVVIVLTPELDEPSSRAASALEETGLL